jgi:hypothetical protein
VFADKYAHAGEVRPAGQDKATGAYRWLGAMVVRDSVLRVHAGYSTYSIPRDPIPPLDTVSEERKICNILPLHADCRVPVRAGICVGVIMYKKTLSHISFAKFKKVSPYARWA